MVPRHFIEPAAPRLAANPPLGAKWIHEIKFDGWRLQVHFTSGPVQILSRVGNDLTKRFADVAEPLGRLAADDVPLEFHPGGA